jgi:hypothetical protein
MFSALIALCVLGTLVSGALSYLTLASMARLWRCQAEAHGQIIGAFNRTCDVVNESTECYNDMAELVQGALDCMVHLDARYTDLRDATDLKSKEPGLSAFAG